MHANMYYLHDSDRYCIIAYPTALQFTELANTKQSAHKDKLVPCSESDEVKSALSIT